MKYLVVLSAFFYFSVYVLIAQNDSVKRIVFISFNPQITQHKYHSISFSKMKELNGGDNLLKEKDINSYTSLSNSKYSTFEGGFTLALAVRLIKSKPNQISRFSLGFQSYESHSSQFTNDSDFVLNTVVSNSPKYTSFSVIERKTKQLYYSNNTELLNLGLAHLFYSNRNKFISFHTGAAMSLQVSISSKINTMYLEDSRIGIINSGESNFQPFDINNSGSSHNGTMEVSKAKGVLYCGIGMPLGVDFNFNKKSETRRRFSFSLEIVPQLNYRAIDVSEKPLFFTMNYIPICISYNF